MPQSTVRNVFMQISAVLALSLAGSCRQLPPAVPADFSLELAWYNRFESSRIYVDPDSTTYEQSYFREDYERVSISQQADTDTAELSQLYAELRSLKPHTLRTVWLPRALAQPGGSSLRLRGRNLRLDFADAGSRFVIPAHSSRYEAIKRAIRDFAGAQLEQAR